jgi:Glycogen debranching enzyme
MQITLTKVNFQNIQRLQEANYLLTNGLGGYSSLTLASSATRNDHCLFMACLKAPNHRYQLVKKIDECIHIGSNIFHLSSQEYVNSYQNFDCMYTFEQFSQEYLPVFHYRVNGVEIIKTIVMVHGKNTLGVQYKIINPLKQKVKLSVLPKYVFAYKDKTFKELSLTVTNHCITNNSVSLYYKHNGKEEMTNSTIEHDLFFRYDARDDRYAVGKQVLLHEVYLETEKENDTLSITYSLEGIKKSVEYLIQQEIDRQKALIAKAEVKSTLGKQLVRASEQFVVTRESTNTKTIIAGYPFFGDWGRDTMIAMLGCTISTNQLDDARNILRTFITYEKKGILPNLFPEHGVEPKYNTIDASLLFVVSLYEYYCTSQDLQFVKEEAYECMQNIYTYYRNGTDYQIKMLDNGLISGGSHLDQLTWMDVRFDDILPTPRHGCAVEINALWYNTLCIIDYFNQLLEVNQKAIKDLIPLVKQSFNEQFYDEELGYLCDYINGECKNKQMRPNQAYAVGLPFPILDDARSKKVLLRLYKELYTPLGMRTLDIKDKDFKAIYTGSIFERDMAYHQGTVWPFMAGQYFIGMLKYFHQDTMMMEIIQRQIDNFSHALSEGCIGQLAEIYDGLIPNQSRGCFAQAWSVSEILRVIRYREMLLPKKQ